jgi:hypothetical protein
VEKQSESGVYHPPPFTLFLALPIHLKRRESISINEDFSINHKEKQEHPLITRR